MEKGFKLNSKFFYLIIAIIILAVIGVGVYAATIGSVSAVNPGHNSTQIFIPLGNNYITLQNAIDSGYLIGANSSPVATTTPPVSSPYHLASQILITKGSYTMTLQEAIAHNVFANGASASYTTTLPPGGEYASNININTTSNVMGFQNAISNSLLSPCPSGQHLDVNQVCVVNVFPSCYPSGAEAACTNAGTMQGGVCVGYSYKAFGTQSTCLATTSCDGSGHCVGSSGIYTGTGKSSCPFGVQSLPGSGTNGYYFCNLNQVIGSTTYRYYGEWSLNPSWSIDNGWASSGGPAGALGDGMVYWGAFAEKSVQCNCDSWGKNCQTCTSSQTWSIKPRSVG